MAWVGGWKTFFNCPTSRRNSKLPSLYVTIPFTDVVMLTVTVVVAWPNKLCHHMCCRQNLHCSGTPPSHDH